jgi:hypothetical protein
MQPKDQLISKKGTHCPDHYCSLLDINTLPRNEINFNVHAYRLAVSTLYALVTALQHSEFVLVRNIINLQRNRVVFFKYRSKLKK